ncbi:MAG: hypothetical protein IK104_10925 [Clostridia bacterium]|nr:hypothetical protein [Clostridia bacterium]
MILLFKRLIALLISAINIYSIMNIGSQNPLKFVRDGALDYVQSADVSLNVNTLEKYQEITGFGASACWWAQDVGKSDNADEVARLLYAPDGLALNVYRYNVGGGEKENPDTRIGGNRATESFLVQNDAGEWVYDFTRDASAQAMLEKCMAYGTIDTVVLFANSPHYSMTRTGQATGGQTEFYSNLPPENYEAYADYFIMVTKYFLEKGVPVKYISPINEPQWSWGGGWVGQEGCHYEPDEVAALMKVFARKLKASGLDVKLMAPESGQIGEVTLDYFDRLVADPEIKEMLGSLAYHSYWADGQIFDKYQFGNTLQEKNYGVNVDMTEWCELPLEHDIESYDSFFRMAEVIQHDLVLTGVNSWSDWVGVNNADIRADGTWWSDAPLAMNADASEIRVATRYYALQHFSKFIPAGSVRVDPNPDVKDVNYQKNDDHEVLDFQLGYVASAFKTPAGKIVVVVINTGTERNFTVTALGKLKAEIYQSTPDGGYMKQIHAGLIPLKTNVPVNSVTTFVLG